MGTHFPAAGEARMIGDTQVSPGSTPARSKVAIRARLLSISANAHLSPPIDEPDDGIASHFCVMVARLSIAGLLLSIIAVLLQGSLLSRYSEREDFLALSSAAQAARDQAAKAEREWIAYSKPGELDHWSSLPSGGPTLSPKRWKSFARIAFGEFRTFQAAADSLESEAQAISKNRRGR